MTKAIDRRFFLQAGGSLAVLAAGPASAFAPPPGDPLYVADLANKIGGRIGVALRGASGGITTERDEFYALCSTFKAPLAGLILDELATGEREDVPFSLNGVDVISHSPVIGPMIAAGETRVSVRALCEAAVTTSDNTAANMLLSLIGGPGGFTRRVKPVAPSLMLHRYEPDLNENEPGSRLDTTSPADMARLVHKMLFGGLIHEDAAATLRGLMTASTTGRDRLRAGLPSEGVIVGDKTGTGGNGLNADVAFVMTEDGSRGIVMASYLDAPSLAGRGAEAAAIHAEIARRVSPLIVSELGL